MSLESGWDRDSQTKKGGMVGLTGKNERESGIWEAYCGPSTIIVERLFCQLSIEGHNRRFLYKSV